MKKVKVVFYVVSLIGFLFLTACGDNVKKDNAGGNSNNDKAKWQQFKAKKAQDELSEETYKPKK